MTNADRIRAMTDKELADLIDRHIDCSTCVYCEYDEDEMVLVCKSPKYKRGNCQDSILDWLQQEG